MDKQSTNDHWKFYYEAIDFLKFDSNFFGFYFVSMPSLVGLFIVIIEHIFFSFN